MSERDTVNAERTGGTSTASAASGNPPVIPQIAIPQSNDEILKQLTRRGFLDAETDTARLLLKRVSYQHLAPYLNVVEASSDRPSLKHAHDLLVFDRRFQSMAFKYIGMFETHFRAAYSGAMAAEHGAFALYDAGLFLRHDLYEQTRSSYDSEVSRRARKSPATARILDNHNGRMPIWNSVEFMTLGTLSKFFANTGDKNVTGSVLRSFGVHKREFSSWARTITAARNVFAHFGHYIVSSQIPNIPLAVHGASMANTAPLYLVIVLIQLLCEPNPSIDPNMSYSKSLQQETLSLLDAFFSIYTDEGSVPGIPSNWRASLSFWDVPL